MQTVIKTLGSFVYMRVETGRIQGSLLSLTQTKWNILQLKPENLSSLFYTNKGVKEILLTDLFFIWADTPHTVTVNPKTLIENQHTQNSTS